jgi:hypothetical protein
MRSTRLGSLSFTMASYPSRASLLGLPAELRLQIYAHLAGFHIHYTRSHQLYDSKPNKRELLCSHQDPTFPQLCFRPAFSGLYLSQDICDPPEWPDVPEDAGNVESIKSRRGQRLAIRQTCQLIYSETHITSISMFADVAHRVLESISCTKLANIRRITLEEKCFLSKHMVDTLKWFENNHTARLPNLQMLALQGFNAHYKFQAKRRPNEVVFLPEKWRDLPLVRQFERILGSRITIVVESWSCLAPTHMFYKGGGERCEMVIIRGVLWRQNGANEGRKTTTCSVRRADVVEGNVLWKYRWQDCGFVIP